MSVIVSPFSDVNLVDRRVNGDTHGLATARTTRSYCMFGNEKPRRHGKRSFEFGDASGTRPHQRGPRFRLQAKPFESQRKQQQCCFLEAPNEKRRFRGRK
jgi:hypothetical protein